MCVVLVVLPIFVDLEQLPSEDMRKTDEPILVDLVKTVRLPSEDTLILVFVFLLDIVFLLVIIISLRLSGLPDRSESRILHSSYVAGALLPCCRLSNIGHC